jgi:hypothetical protein
MAESNLIQSLWPLPGGNAQYLVTLNRIVNWAATAQTPDRDAFETWFMSHFNVSKSTLSSYLQVVTAMGMLDPQAGGVLQVSPMGEQLLRSDD